MKLSNHRFFRSAAAVVFGLAGLALAGTASAACQPQAAQYNLSAGRLDTALQDFGHVSGCPVKVDTRLLGDDKAPALKGRYTPSAALIRLVRGSGLEVHVNDNQYAVNHADQNALDQQIKAMQARVKSAAGNHQIDAKTAQDLNAQLASAKTQAAGYIRQQGFLSAAEKASYARLVAWIGGRLEGATAHQATPPSAQ